MMLFIMSTVCVFGCFIAFLSYVFGVCVCFVDGIDSFVSRSQNLGVYWWSSQWLLVSVVGAHCSRNKLQFHWLLWLYIFFWQGLKHTNCGDLNTLLKHLVWIHVKVVMCLTNYQWFILSSCNGTTESCVSCCQTLTEIKLESWIMPVQSESSY